MTPDYGNCGIFLIMVNRSINPSTRPDPKMTPLGHKTLYPEISIQHPTPPKNPYETPCINALAWKPTRKPRKNLERNPRQPFERTPYRKLCRRTTVEHPKGTSKGIPSIIPPLALERSPKGTQPQPKALNPKPKSLNLYTHNPSPRCTEAPSGARWRADVARSHPSAWVRLLGSWVTPLQ